MANKSLKTAKAAAIVARLVEIHDSREILIGLLDEAKLDHLIVGLGIGSVWLHADSEGRSNADGVR